MPTVERHVATCPTPRGEVYAAIDSERDYQDQFVMPSRDYYATHTIGEFILMLNQYAAQAREAWTHHPDGPSVCMDEVRKIAALAVRCMEQHGAPHRGIVT